MEIRYLPFTSFLRFALSSFMLKLESSLARRGNSEILGNGKRHVPFLPDENFQPKFPEFFYKW